jgi:hypothetical protein
MSASVLQKGSESSAERSAGRMCGRGGSIRSGFGGSSPGGVLAGVEMDAVERSDAAIVRRTWKSVASVPVTTHANI